MLRLRNLLGLLILGLASTPVGATTIPNAIYTLDASVPFSIIGAEGTIDAYNGPLDFVNDAICLDGACGDPNDFSTLDWMVFRVTVSSGSLDQVTVGALFEASSGVGYFDDASGTNPISGDSSTNANSPEMLFSSLTGTSAPLFVVFGAGLLPTDGGGFLGTGATNFGVRLGGASDQFMGFVTTPIPEPTTALLLGLGLIGCRAVRRLSRG